MVFYIEREFVDAINTNSTTDEFNFRKYGEAQLIEIILEKNYLIFIFLIEIILGKNLAC